MKNKIFKLHPQFFGKFIKNKYVTFRKKLNDPEFKLLLKLDIARTFKISFSCLGYLTWLYIAKIGWSNFYSFFKLFIEDGSLKEALNVFGYQIFFVLLISWTMLQIVKLSVTSTPATFFLPLKRGIEAICKQGSILFLLGLFTKEINLYDYKGLIIKLINYVVLYFVSLAIEKVFYKKVIKDIHSEIIPEKFTISTPFGQLKEIKLNSFCLNSKWEKYIYRNEDKLTNGFYNPIVNELIYDTGAIAEGERMVLKGFFDYEYQFRFMCDEYSLHYTESTEGEDKDINYYI